MRTEDCCSTCGGAIEGDLWIESEGKSLHEDTLECIRVLKIKVDHFKKKNDRSNEEIRALRNERHDLVNEVGNLRALVHCALRISGVITPDTDMPSDRVERSKLLNGLVFGKLQAKISEIETVVDAVKRLGVARRERDDAISKYDEYTAREKAFRDAEVEIYQHSKRLSEGA